jgi:phosphotransacetylase
MTQELSSPPAAGNPFTDYLIAKLRSHPKRVVFTEGEDLRVLRAAARLVAAEAVVPVLLGSREKIRAMAADHGVSLKFINVIEPARSSDLGLFCQRFAKVERYRNHAAADPADVVSRPHYFGAMMVQYGQADALVGGNQSLPATLFRALLHTIQPLPGVPKMFGMMVLVAPHLQHFGKDGVLFLADCGLLPQPTVDQLAAIALETGKLARHFLGREPHIALLSHSTKGSAGTEDARRMAAATALAVEKAKEAYLDFHISGEIQADVALDPMASEIKLPDAPHREPADVLVFPNLDAAHISLKLLQHCAGALNYGQILAGLARPCAQVPRTATEEAIFGSAAAVGVEAIKYHQLYPEGEV